MASALRIPPDSFGGFGERFSNSVSSIVTAEDLLKSRQFEKIDSGNTSYLTYVLRRNMPRG